MKKAASYLLSLYYFFIHRYRPSDFSLKHVKYNYKILISCSSEAVLSCNREGRLFVVSSPFRQQLLRIANILLWNSLKKRREKALYYTLLTLCLEIRNPFDLKILDSYMKKKILLIKRLIAKFEKQNDLEDMHLQLDLYYRNSLLQERIIKTIEKAINLTPHPLIIQDAILALKQGLFPVLVIHGLSGSYWIRGTDQEIAGLFKPFDEECFAPHNPLGPSYQGALGMRTMRSGIRVGESAHREVAAYLVDQFFGFGIVPKTTYASFTHTAFYAPQKSHELARESKKKYGSFQEYIEGFIPLANVPHEKWQEAITDEEFQLLVVLDVILGNTDRNMGNILIGDKKIAAIDHGLCLPDLNLHLTYWYWNVFEQGKKPLYPSFINLLRTFPFAKLEGKLRKKCFIDNRSFARLKERVIFFREGVLLGKTPAELAPLFNDQVLFQLFNCGEESLPLLARALIKDFKPTD